MEVDGRGVSAKATLEGVEASICEADSPILEVRSRKLEVGSSRCSSLKSI